MLLCPVARSARYEEHKIRDSTKHLEQLTAMGLSEHVWSYRTHPVDLERSSHKQQAGGQLSKENHALALEAASKEDKHCARGDAVAELCRFLHMPPLERLLHVICWVETRSLHTQVVQRPQQQDLNMKKV